MGSVSGYFGNPGFALYSASKAFTRYLSEGLWYEFKKHNVDLICPVVGPTDTPTMTNAYGELENAIDPSVVPINALEKLGSGPVWVSEDIQAQVSAVEAMSSEERSTVSAKWAEEFAKLGKKPRVPAKSLRNI